MDVTITAKVKLLPTHDDKEVLLNTLRAVRNGLNFASDVIFTKKIDSFYKLHSEIYHDIRSTLSLKSQMSQSVMKTAIAKYKSMKTNGIKDTKAVFKKPEYDLVWNRDYSLVNGFFSVNALNGRVKVPFKEDGMSHFFDGSWKFGTAKLIIKKNKFYLHIPMTKSFNDFDINHIKNIVGVDRGINFIATTYDNFGQTEFYSGKKIKNKRGHYKKLRQDLQKKQTPSSRRRLKRIGSRENRFMADVNHCISKALARNAGKNTLFILEDLSDIRNATEVVRKKDRYVSVSWAYSQLSDFISYKAYMNSSTVHIVDPRYTSQTCPKCNYTKKTNRNKKLHSFTCCSCAYRSNDDRIAAMNLYNKGIEYLCKVTQELAPA